MKFWLLLALLTLSPSLLAATPYAQSKPLALRSATPNMATVPRYERLELTLDLSATYDNPFEPDDIDVWAEFKSPQGQTVRVNGFLDQPFKRALVNGGEQITPAGEPFWSIRFAPDAVGTWRYQIFARDKTGTVQLLPAKMRVMASPDPGFVRVSKRNPHVFAFAGEKPFFAIGENMGWGGKRGSYDYDDWLTALSKSGGNWVRVWMSSWNGALEWTPSVKGDWHSGEYHGLGVYSLDNSWKMDAILEAAQRSHVYVMLCLGMQEQMDPSVGFFGEGQWKSNPYNAANGGPCATPKDFWTNPVARKFYRQRLRYLAARYASYSNLHSWEFWNEVSDTPAAWISEMGSYLKNGADPYNHLRTTTYGNDAIWRDPVIDFTQTHNYGEGNVPDHAPIIHDDARQNQEYGKPHLMGEFGIDWRKSDIEYDPQGLGINLHNGLWAGALSGDAGSGMIWWWDNYVHPKKVYAPFVGIARFVQAVPWTRGAWTPLRFDSPHVLSGPETFGDLTLPTGTGWGKAKQSDFRIPPDGPFAGTLPSFLYSPGKADMRTVPALHVRYAQPGRFVVHIGTVSDTTLLRITLDGKTALEKLLSATPPAAPNEKTEYESTKLRPEYKNYEAVFNKDYGIDVPAGSHTITLDNVAGDWASLDSISLTHYSSSRFPAVNLYGLANGREAIFWAQNPQHNWKNAFDKKAIIPLSPTQTVLRGLPNGAYTIEWWDTTRGEPTRREAVRSVNGALPLRLPELPADIAARILPQK